MAGNGLSEDLAISSASIDHSCGRTGLVHPPGPYEVLCEYQGRVPSETWGSERQDEVRYIVRKLDWWDVYELIERHASYLDAERIERVFAENGIGFEFRDGEITAYDPEAEELAVLDVEDKTVSTRDPGRRFFDAKEQYRKAVEFMRQKPPDLENAVANAVNAIEGAVTVITGEKSLSSGLRRLYSAERTPLRQSIEQLHNYGSAVPGVRQVRTLPRTSTCTRQRTSSERLAVHSPI